MAGDLGKQPWDQQSSESGPAYQAFRAYRDMGVPRSLRRCAEGLGKDPSLVARWSSAHDWQERVKSWDLEQDRQRREAMAVENVQAGIRHASIAASGLAAAASVNQAWLERVAELAREDKGLKKLDLETLSELMVKVNRAVPRLIVGERLARGMTTESVEHVGGADQHRQKAEAMSDEALEAFLLGTQTAAGVPISEVEDDGEQDGGQQDRHGVDGAEQSL